MAPVGDIRWESMRAKDTRHVRHQCCAFLTVQFARQSNLQRTVVIDPGRCPTGLQRRGYTAIIRQSYGITYDTPAIHRINTTCHTCLHWLDPWLFAVLPMDVLERIRAHAMADVDSWIKYILPMDSCHICIR
jgi:hypothetical protein